MALVVKERELRNAIERLNRPPKLVVTDSQAFLKVAADTPPEVPMTSFSILFSRFKGDLISQVEGTLAIDDLSSGANILIAEACSHHPIAEDIGRVKIPRWLTQYVGGKLQIEHMQGHDFPDDLSAVGPHRSTAAPAPSIAAPCSAASCAAARPACRSPTTASSSPTAWASSSAPCSRSRPPSRRCRAARARRAGHAAAEPVTAGLPDDAPSTTWLTPAAHDIRDDDASPLPAPRRRRRSLARGDRAWLRETDEARLERLWAAADEVRRRYVGDAVHLRGLVEISNHCVRGCTYCGIRAGNRGVERYRVLRRRRPRLRPPGRSRSATARGAAVRRGLRHPSDGWRRRCAASRPRRRSRPSP